MLDALAAKDFESHLNTEFRLTLDDQTTVPLELIRVEGVRGDTVAESKREPFSIILRSADNAAYEQQICRLEHERLGELHLFLVPIGPSRDGGMCYEAVFS